MAGSRGGRDRGAGQAPVPPAAAPAMGSSSRQGGHAGLRSMLPALPSGSPPPFLSTHPLQGHRNPPGDVCRSDCSTGLVLDVLAAAGSSAEAAAELEPWLSKKLVRWGSK